MCHSPRAWRTKASRTMSTASAGLTAAATCAARKTGMRGMAAYPRTVSEPQVTICDVGPRDGLQNEKTVLLPAVRAELANRLADAGVPRIEAASFVNPARVPAMAGAEDVVERISRWDKARFAGLVLNERGYDRLAATPLDEVHFTFAATESFNERNAGQTVDESLAAWTRIAERAHADGRRPTVTLSVAFGCPFEGPVSPDRVRKLAEEAAAGGDGGVPAPTN